MYKNKSIEGKNNICGKRFVTEIELKAFAQILGITTDELLDES